jgi:hypothetical protein
MFKLISIANVIPKSLFIVDVKTEPNLGASVISMGGFGRVFRGEHKGQQVALKVVDKGLHHVSALSNFLFSDNIDYLEGFTQEGLLPGSHSLAISRTPFCPPSPGNI